ncbi:MAG TPA: type II toxin-antitoxin system HicA family toxin [Rhodanobacteraceae bacterium]
MKRPREIAAQDLVIALEKLGYQPACRTENHIRLTCTETRTLIVTIPDHSPLGLATLDAILAAIAPGHRMDKAELAGKLFG